MLVSNTFLLKHFGCSFLDCFASLFFGGDCELLLRLGLAILLVSSEGLKLIVLSI